MCVFFFFLLSLMLVHEIYEEEKFELFALRKFFISSRFDLTFLRNERNPGNFILFVTLLSISIYFHPRHLQFRFFQPSEFSSPVVTISRRYFSNGKVAQSF